MWLTLMYELIEGVLSICAWLTPNNRSSRVIDERAIPCHIFPVGFHVALLEVSGETTHVLVVGKDGVCLSTEEVVVPHTQHGQQDRNILF